MEVHHHPHVEKKNFREYLLEDLMIFVAVSMGFIAENIREHLVNKEHEASYIASFYKDLSADQKDLQVLIASIYRQQIEPGKVLPSVLQHASVSKAADSVYVLLRKIIRQQGIRAYVTDRTFEQIKNAGEMRLITNKAIADSLVDYYKEVVLIDYFQQTLLGYKAKLLDNLPLILKSNDYAVAADSTNSANIPEMHLHLQSTDAVAINRILLQNVEIRTLSITIRERIVKLLAKNRSIQQMISQKYDIEK